MRAYLCLALLTLLASTSCKLLNRGGDGDAGVTAATSTATSTTTATSAAAPLEAPTEGKLPDATSCNPGVSLNPPDKGKTFTSDQFRYTLLDARTDEITNPLAKGKKVILVKLQVENITAKPDLNLSVAETDLTHDKAAVDRNKDKQLLHSVDFMYDRARMCLDLGGGVGKGKIPPGAKVVGYYAYAAGDPVPASLYWSARNMAVESMAKGILLKVAGSFRLK